MAEYIDRGAALDSICTACESVPIDEKELCPYRLAGCQEYANLLTLRAADVKPVVMCRDCENWQRDWEPVSAPDCRFCGMIDLMTKPDFFCGYGEKQEPAPGTYDLLHEEGGWNLQ